MTTALFRLGRARVAAAAVLVLLSLIDKITLGPLTLAGRETFSILAGLVLVWPLVAGLATRGGSAEFLGVKLQLNELEKRTEGGLAIELEAVRAEITDLRGRLHPAGAATPEMPDPARDQAVRKMIEAAATEYRDHSVEDDWRGRANVDLRLTGLRASAQLLEEILMNDHRPEAWMAVAVVSGSPFTPGELPEVARLIVRLLGHPEPRVRRRAAYSAERHLKRPDTPQAFRDQVVPALKSTLRSENHYSTIEALQSAIHASKAVLS